MIAGIGSRDVRILSACLPVELARLNDDAAEGSAVSADELGRGMNNDVSAVLDGSDQIRSTEGIVHNYGQAVLMSDSCDRVDVRDIAVGIAEGLEIYGSGIVLDRCFNLCEIVRVNESGGDAVLGKCVREQIIAAAVDGLLSYDVSAVCS